jgi:hypothetical protein
MRTSRRGPDNFPQRHALSRYPHYVHARFLANPVPMPVRLTNLTRFLFSTISFARSIRVIGHAASLTRTTQAIAGILCDGISPENKKSGWNYHIVHKG